MAVIRAMHWWDIEPVARLEQVCFPRDTWTTEQFWHELAQPTRRYFVAEEDDRIVGYAGAYLLPPDSDVQTVAVDPHDRGRGLARDLMAQLLECARAEGSTSMILEVRADNAEAIGLYESLGFEAISRRTAYYPDGADAVIMRRRPIVELDR